MGHPNGNASEALASLVTQAPADEEQCIGFAEPTRQASVDESGTISPDGPRQEAQNGRCRCLRRRSQIQKMSAIIPSTPRDGPAPLASAVSLRENPRPVQSQPEEGPAANGRSFVKLAATKTSVGVGSVQGGAVAGGTDVAASRNKSDTSPSTNVGNVVCSTPAGSRAPVPPVVEAPKVAQAVLQSTPKAHPPAATSKSLPLQQSNFQLGPKSVANANKKTLVLDLDETLVHSSFRFVQNADMIISVEIDGDFHKVYVRKRPGVDEFLVKVATLYEVVVYTASMAKYANPLLDDLDKQCVCSWRLFREACTKYPQGYVKDLSKIGRNLKDVIIIDNSPTCYALQPENAIPIKTWRDDANDRELLDLIPILQSLATVDNIPWVLKQVLWSNDGDGEDDQKAVDTKEKR